MGRKYENSKDGIQRCTVLIRARLTREEMEFLEGLHKAYAAQPDCSISLGGFGAIIFGRGLEAERNAVLELAKEAEGSDDESER